MELANALAAAVGGEPVPATVSTSAEETHSDSHRTATVVSDVLQRMLPSIMLEVKRELEARKKNS